MPLEKSRRNQTILWTGVALICAILLYILSPVLAPFMLGLAIAYVLAPVVRYMEAMKIPRPIGIGIAVLSLIVVLLSVLLIVLPLLHREFMMVLGRLPHWVQHYNETYAANLSAILGTDARIDMASMRAFVQSTLTGTSTVTSSVSDYIWSSSATVITVGITLVLTPIVVIYLLLDWQGFITKIYDLIPRRFLASTQSILTEIHKLLSSYLRGQLLVMTILAGYYSSGLMIAGFDSAIPIGVLTGMLIFIPYVGFGIGLTLAILSGVLQFGDYYGLIAVAIVYGIGQLLEGMVLTPNIMGNRIGLHPLVIIFSVFVFGQLFGFFGVLLALPLCATASVLVRRVYSSYRGSEFYTDET